MKRIYLTLIMMLLAMPGAVYGQSDIGAAPANELGCGAGTGDGYTFKGFACGVFDVLLLIVPLLWAAALLVFFWGLAKFIFHAGDKEAIEGGKRIMIWGIVALFVMFSIWGLLNLLSGDLGFGSISFDALPFFKEQ